MIKSMEADVAKEKLKLRKELLEKRNALGDAEGKEKSLAICGRLISLPEYVNAEYIFSYIPVRHEVDIIPILEKAFLMGKRVAVPRCLDKNGHMDFFEIWSFGDLENGAFNIPEPKMSCPKVEVKNGVMLIPGVGFDKQKNRLGYGGGYYDRFIGISEGVCYIAPAYELQVTEMLPVEEHDRKVDKIVTEQQIL